MPRLTFGQLLALDNPGGGRGGGRGGLGGRGGNGGGRGRGGIGSSGRGGRGGRGGNAFGAGRGRGGRGGMRGGHFGADYTNVALDYGNVNTSRYTRAEQYLNADPNPHEEKKNKGKGRAFAPHGTPRVPTGGESTPNSGTATPITSGLGFHRNRPLRLATRVDKEGTTYWGGGAAPLFVKAGELFRDGEVDVVKCDGETLVVETYPMSDPSAPQMMDLLDDTEMVVDSAHRDVILEAIDRAHQLGEAHHEEPVIHWNDLVAAPDQVEDKEISQETQGETQPAVLAEIAAEEPREDAEAVIEARDEPAMEASSEVIEVSHANHEDEAAPAAVQSTSTFVSIESTSSTFIENTLTSITVETTSSTAETTGIEIEQPMPAKSETVPVMIVDSVADVAGSGESEEADETLDEDIDEDEFTMAADDDLFIVDTTGADMGADDTLFFVDTGPSTSTNVPVYDGPSSVPLGADRSEVKRNVEEESIVFRPRIIADPVATAGPSSAPQRPATNFELSNIYVDPRVTLNRKDRKAAKKAKRARNKRSKRRANGGYDLYPRDDSDIDWGSDGPPVKILNVIEGDAQMDALGQTLADTDLDVDLGREADVDPDIDIEAMARFGQSMSLGHGGDAMVEMETDSDEWEEKGRPRKFDPADPWAAGGSDSDDNSDSEDLDETADFAALAAAYDSEDDDDDDSDLDKIFSGHQAWNDEDVDDEDEDQDAEADWFLQSMEDALDRGVLSASRKERKAVFRAIERGEPLALPTAPVKKSKKGAHVPPELHAQWEKDRQKKAEKKQAREMERVLGLLGGKKKGKKGKKGMADAAAIAHLIPRSAAEVADLFDIDSDSDDGGWKAGPIKRHGRNPLLPKTMDEIDEEIRWFLADPKRTSLPLPAMDKEARKKVHMIAECYNLKSQSKGKGAARFPVLIKLARSGLRDEAKLERLLTAASHTGGAFYKALYMRKKEKNGGGSKGGGFARGTGASARAREGELVGEGAEKIGIDNIGHRLLSMMGWSEGATIGREGVGGLDNPIVAVVKNTKSGLGA